MYLIQMNRMLTENRLLAVILKNNMYIINQQCIDHISHLLDNDRALKSLVDTKYFSSNSFIT